MDLKRTKRVIAVFSMLLLLLISALGLRSQAFAAPAASPGPVDLTPGACVDVRENDAIAFEWNPAFEHPGGVSGMQKVFMVFAMRGHEEEAMKGRGGILLTAMTAAERAGRHDSNIAALPNGFYRATFQVSLRGVAPGEYYLVNARGDARLYPRYEGERPQMTNSPLRFSYCLNVVPVTQQAANGQLSSHP